MIGISGLARAGKDTLAKSLKTIIEKEWGCEVEIIHLADTLKLDLDKFISSKFNFDVFTEKNEQKELIRPILVAYGEAMKSKWGENIWLNKLYKNIEKEKFYIIADIRFDFEVKDLQEKRDGWVIHISKNGNEVPPNETEAINDPKVRAIVDQAHHWAAYGKDKIQECDGHASVLWQMISQERKEKWKTTLNL
jgi:hypothetical protein|tara:strand:+ start:1395 stop:1973 length:579 start_codon:yes stop_codon:yes gene_type:complete